MSAMYDSSGLRAAAAAVRWAEDLRVSLPPLTPAPASAHTIYP